MNFRLIQYLPEIKPTIQPSRDLRISRTTIDWNILTNPVKRLAIAAERGDLWCGTVN